MSIWGHEYVHIEKDAVKQEWRVFTVSEPRSLLCTVAWRDALRTYTEVERAQYPDYLSAVTTCASDPATALTEEEEQQAGAATSAGVGTGDVSTEPDNILRVDFVRGRRT